MTKIKERLRITWHICWYQLKTHSMTGKTLFLAIFIFFYIRGMLFPLLEFSAVVKEPITPWTFSVLMNDSVFPFVITFFYIIWICDAPFITSNHLYVVGRCGKRAWVQGEILFLGLNTFLYIAFCYACSLISVISQLSYEPRWGKVLGTLAFTDASSEYPIPFIISTGIMNRFTYFDALLYTFFFMWGSLFLLGLCVFLFNWLSNHILGTVIAFALTMLDITITNLLSYKWRMLSPVSMMRISTITGGFSITINYVISFLFITNICMIFIIKSIARYRKGI